MGKVEIRLYPVCIPMGSKEGERFYLLMLLLYVPGVRNFIDLRTINDVTVETFKYINKYIQVEYIDLGSTTLQVWQTKLWFFK